MILRSEDFDQIRPVPKYRAGIYFLCNRGHVLRIGYSYAIERTIGETLRDEPDLFDQYAFRECEEEEFWTVIESLGSYYSVWVPSKTPLPSPSSSPLSYSPLSNAPTHPREGLKAIQLVPERESAATREEPLVNDNPPRFGYGRKGGQRRRKEPSLFETIAAPREDVARFFEEWNKRFWLTKLLMTERQTRMVREALERPFFLANWMESFNLIAKSRFLRGGGGKKFTINLDWYLDPDNFDKIMEGKYSDEEEVPIKPAKTRINAEGDEEII